MPRFTPEILQNIIAFMERVPVTGKEAFEWCRCYSTLQFEKQMFSTSTMPPPPAQLDSE